MTRREHKGAAPPAALTFALGGGTGDLTVVCTDLTGWPTGDIGPFFAVIDRGRGSEEKVLCESRTSNTLILVSRGQDDTTRTAHDIGATIEHIFTALEADEANAHINSTADIHGITGNPETRLTNLENGQTSLTDLVNDLDDAILTKEPLLPSRTGQDGKFLSADNGWQTVPPGEQGIQGETGAPGQDGNTIRYGTAAPGPDDGNDGDFYIRTTTSYLYGPKEAGDWPAGTSLVGATGATGATGAAGTNGNTILYGTAAPTTEGVNGDFYIRTSTNYIYGPKAGGSWPAGTSLVGATGATGATGPTGATGAGVPTGGSTDQVLAKINGTDYNTQWVTLPDSVLKSLIDAKGDLLVGTANDTVTRLAVGTNGYVLTADSGQTEGVKWAASGGSGGLVLIDSGTFTTATEFHVDQFDGTYDDYDFEFWLTALSATNPYIYIRFRNGSTDNTTDTLSGGGHFYHQSANSGFAWNAVNPILLAQAHTTYPDCFTATLRICSPNVARRTSVRGQITNHDGTNSMMQIVGGNVMATTQYNGIKVYPQSGTFSGGWRLRGVAT